MKSVYLIAVLIILLSTNVFSQDVVAPTNEIVKNDKELSLNVNTFIRQYLGLGGEQIFVSEPFLINYHSGHNNKYLRMGAGLVFSISTVTENDNFGNNDVERSNRFINFDYRIGYERRKSINKRWSYHYGFDFVFEYNVLKSESDQFSNFVSTDRQIGAGFGPIFGVRFNINNRMMLWTEASMYYMYRRNTFFTKVDSDIVEDDKIQSFATNVRAPISVNIGIKL